MKKAQKQANIQTIKLKNSDNFVITKKALLLDNRLTHSERNVLNILLSMSDNFYISIRATAKYLNISEPTFNKMLNNFKSLGYLEIEKNGNNYKYIFKDTSKYLIDFKPYLIESYTMQQLNYVYNNNETPTKYKNLIKKYFDSLSQDIDTYNNVLTEIKEIEKPTIDLQEQEEEKRTNEIIEYLSKH